ncbi:hypothetical protein [Piscibacillus salipiscarius]|uniref:HEPN AbiU2-like domain-containing protein n=1 Tax=Piscibacillus salipiscarius TaxID=299480 RepID=A0ABW5Q7H7_9BACI|nr:hypothetical protein [Piscibacillus salipiscarius]
MDNKYFPNNPNELDRIMRLYEQEIQIRKEWMNECVVQLQHALKNSTPSMVIHYATSVINQAMVIVRILDKDATSSRPKDKERSKERAKIIHDRNPELIEPPEMLRKIRNDYEHFEERMDDWATTSVSKNYVDLIVSDSESGGISGIEETDKFRQLTAGYLTFWNTEVDLQEVINWVGKVSRTINN